MSTSLSEHDLQTVLLAVLLGEADPTEALPLSDDPDPDEEPDEDADNTPDGDEVDGGSEVWIESAVTFADAGVLTYNKGVVVRLSDGSEFQLTIVRSAESRR